MKITNSSAWAMGFEQKGRFTARRVVWGRTLARQEKWRKETLLRVKIIPWPQKAVETGNYEINEKSPWRRLWERFFAGMIGP